MQWFFANGNDLERRNQPIVICVDYASLDPVASMLESIRAALRREMTGRNKAGAILAILTCPCHAAMLVIVLAGTAVGSFLAAIQAYLYLGFTLVFTVGLWLMVRRSNTVCEIPQPSAPRRASDDHV